MNSSRFIEGATLMSIGVFCASALVSFALHSTHVLNGRDESVAMINLPPVMVSAKRMSAEEKAAWHKEQQEAAMKSLMVNHDKNGDNHAG